jgi:secreted PhoX family phosphatase
MISRRGFLGYATATTAAFAGLGRWLDHPVFAEDGYGPLVPDEKNLLDLPRGFAYQVLSRTGERMSDGFLVPGGHDGMAAFGDSSGRTILVRNHELDAGSRELGPFGPGNAMVSKLRPTDLYDPAPMFGGTTTLVYSTQTRRLERHFLSLAGTVRNCAGGPTPWNTWISCEESTARARGAYRRDHGYNFEVPAGDGIAAPIPLKAMGRFNHEAIAVGPAGIVYQTEDRVDGLIYRFVPNRPQNLQQGGKLQALKIRDRAGMNTNNRTSSRIPLRKRLEVEWVTLENVESPDDDLRKQGHSLGAAIFERGEGIWTGEDGIYFVCTSGGVASIGQVWRYVPSGYEGTSGESTAPGTIEIFIEPNDERLLENADNLTVAPWGDLFLCEDGPGDNRVVGVSRDGTVYDFARNVLNDSEFAGAVFSPDGSTLFVNIQRPGLTLAVTGPWRNSTRG